MIHVFFLTIGLTLGRRHCSQTIPVRDLGHFPKVLTFVAIDGVVAGIVHFLEHPFPLVNMLESKR